MYGIICFQYFAKMKFGTFLILNDGTLKNYRVEASTTKVQCVSTRSWSNSTDIVNCERIKRITFVTYCSMSQYFITPSFPALTIKPASFFPFTIINFNLTDSTLIKVNKKSWVSNITYHINIVLSQSPRVFHGLITNQKLRRSAKFGRMLMGIFQANDAVHENEVKIGQIIKSYAGQTSLNELKWCEVKWSCRDTLFRLSEGFFIYKSTYTPSYTHHVPVFVSIELVNTGTCFEIP